MAQHHTRQARKEDSAIAPTSGAAGGPATGRGIKYQVDYAVLQSLELISKALSMPHIPFAIWMEPRNVEGDTLDFRRQEIRTNIERGYEDLVKTMYDAGRVNDPERATLNGRTIIR